MVILVCALLAVGAIGFTLFVRERDIPAAAVENPELKHLETRRQILLENMKDLQFEYLQGKLSDGDYQSLKEGFQLEMAEILDATERLQASQNIGTKHPVGRAPNTKQKASSVAGNPAANPPAGVPCPSCSFSNLPSNRFCGQCGTALP